MLRPLTLALVTAAMLLVGPPATARSVDVVDAEGDAVLSKVLCERPAIHRPDCNALSSTTVPSVRALDLTLLRAQHTATEVVLIHRYRSVPTSILANLSVSDHVRGDNGREIELSTELADPGAVKAYPSEGACTGVVARVYPRAHALVTRIPRTCLGSPERVQVNSIAYRIFASVPLRAPEGVTRSLERGIYDAAFGGAGDWYGAWSDWASAGQG